MAKPTVRNSFLATLVAAGLLLGGCALEAQRAAMEQARQDPTRPTTQAKTERQTGETDEPLLDDGELALNVPSEELAVDALDAEADTDGTDLEAWYSSQDEAFLNGQEDTAASEEFPSLALSTSGDEMTGSDVAAETTGEPSGSDIQSDSDNSKEEDTDLWDRIRRGFKLPERQDRRIAGEARWFSRNQEYLDRVADQAQPYLHYIVSQVEKRGMPTEIVLLPVVESAFQPYAYSPGRAAGIWQFVPETGRRFGLKLNWWYDGRRDIVASTRAALDYLQYLHDTFDGDWLLALAAYNAGEGTVLKAMHRNRRRHKPTDFWSLRLPRETQQYVPRLLALRDLVAAPEKLGIRLKPIPNEPYLTTVDIDSQLDLATAAKLAEMPLEELHQLNPGFNRWATAPDGPHHLLLPLDKAELFATRASQLPPEDRVHWVRHRVRQGETLGGLARRYRTTVRVLRQLNNLRGDLIRAGHYLVIPIPARSGRNQPAALQEIASSDERIVHTVTAGDNLWTLARRYGTTVRQLCRWNGISSRALLHPGQQIVVALGSPVKAIPAVLHKLGGPTEVVKPRKITYRVRRGDSLFRISRRFRVTIAQLTQWNGIKRNQYLHPGQKLTLYVALTDDSEKS